MCICIQNIPRSTSASDANTNVVIVSHALICTSCLKTPPIQLSPNLLKQHAFPSPCTLTKPIVLSAAHQMFSAPFKSRGIPTAEVQMNQVLSSAERKGDHWARLRMENRAISRSLTRLHKSRQGLNAYFLSLNRPPGPKVVDQRCFCSTRAVREAIGLIWSISDRWKCFNKSG